MPDLNKKELICLAIRKPLEFKWEHVEALRELAEFEDIRDMIKRIYDLNEDLLQETSNANSGGMGYLNRKSTKKRHKQYFKRIRSGRHQKQDGKIILAEGDSWFQFPVFVRDIIDWLTKKNPDYAIYSIAYGGDWITNIIYEYKYVGELAVHNPSAFLVSGGGNDLVGGNRLAIMVSNEESQPKWG